MAQFLAPLINTQQFDANGDPLSGGFIEVFLAGSSTPAATTSDQAGAVPNTNPITLNTLGLNTQGAVWLTGGAAYKYVIKNAANVTLRTIDNISGINDTTVAIDQWVAYQAAPTYVSATSFTVGGDQTGVFQVNRRTKTTNTGGVVYSTIKTSAYSAPNTTVTVANDSGTLDAGLSSVSYGLISPQNSSLVAPGNYAGFTGVTANTVLTAVHIGRLIQIGATGLTVSLPVGATVPLGARLSFVTTVPFTVARSGADTILGPVGSVTSQLMYGNCSIAWTGTAWNFELGGDPSTAGVPSGRVLFPGGLMMQWGTTIVTLNGASVGNIPFPATFGTVYTVVPSNGDNSVTTIAPVINSMTAADFNVLYPAAGAITVRCNWIALGLAA
jgi:hypothetical protein